MLKKIFLAVALIALPFIGANAQTAKALKIGIVDTNTLIQAHPDTQEANKKLADASKKYEDEFARLQEEMKRMVDEYQNMKADELPAIKERKAREVQDYQTKIEQFYQNAQQDLQRMQQELLGPVIQKIRTAVEAVGQEGGFSLIEDNGAQMILYYAAPVEDITNQVKAKLGIK